MGKDTAIAWTQHTFNPWWGCTEVSPGCDHCYARSFSERPIHPQPDGSRGALAIWGKGKPRRTFGDAHWKEPLAWNKAAAKAGKPALVFCASMADVLDDEAPEGERERLWALIDATPHLLWQLLTKRPHRYVRYLPATGFRHRNALFGVTCEQQKFYDARWPMMLALRWSIYNGTGWWPKLWVSYEPALGPLVMQPVKNIGVCTCGAAMTFGAHVGLAKHGEGCLQNVAIHQGNTELPDWIICGGESGRERRPFERAWADALLAESKRLGVKFFMKQMGGLTPDQGKAAIPAELMVQEFPA